MLRPALSDGDLFRPPVADVSPEPGFNPRLLFDDDEQRALNASVRAEGVLEPIIVRPHPREPGRFWIVAGERRWRASLAVGLPDIPAIYREVDDKRALAIATAENTERVAMSAAAEARLARRMVDACDGDRDTAAKELSWSRTKVDVRLALNHASGAVLDALERREIRVGHAELLATLPGETQRGTLEAVLAEGVSVADLKARLASFAQSLEAAIFDKTDCALCPHNSSLQASLFSASVGEARCANRACYAAKTAEALRAQAKALEGEYNCVYLDLERSPDTWTPLCKGGRSGVGAGQYAACQGCRHFGALVSSKPGEEGKVERSICFNLTCNAERVAEHRARSAQADEAPSDASEPAGQPKKPSRPRTGKAATKRTTAASRPRKVAEAVERFLRDTASRTVTTDRRLVKALTLNALSADARWPTLTLDGEPPFRCARNARAENLRQCYALDETRLDRLIDEAACHLIGTTDEEGAYGNRELVRTAVAVLQVTKQELAGEFRLDEAFLRCHTKAGIESLMREAAGAGEASFAQWYEQRKGRGAFAKLMKRKTDEIVKEILGSAFDFSTFVPACIRERIEP